MFDCKGKERDLEMGLFSAPNPDLPMPSLSPRMAAPAFVLSNSGKALASPNFEKTLFISNSDKQMDRGALVMLITNIY